MLKLQEVRSLYPEYNNLTDHELSTALHQSRYAQMPYEEFAKGFGGPMEEDKAEVAAREYNAANPNNKITVQDIRNKDRSGILGGLQLLGEGIYDAVTDQFPEDMARIWRGGDVDPSSTGMADDVIKRQRQDSAARIPSLQEAEGSILANSLYQGPKSIATSMATGLTGAVMGGAAGSAAGPAGTMVGSMVGGGALSGAAFYRMAKDQFVDEVQQAMHTSTGRTLSSEEAVNLNAAIDADASEFGLWEAGPEAISQFFTLGLIKGAGGAVLKNIGLGGVADAIGKRAITRVPAKLAAELAEEETTEATTYFGQEGIRQRYGLRPDAPTLGEFANEQAGPVAVGAVLQLGGMRAAQALGGRMQRRSEEVSAGESDAEGSAKFALPQAPLSLPESPIAMGAERDKAAAIPMEAIDRFLPEEEYESTKKWVQEQERLAKLDHLPTKGFFPSAADAGETIDLLSWRGTEENPVFSMDALPAPKQHIPLPMAGIQSLLGLPAGSGAMPMGTQQTGRGAIAPPSSFAHPPIAPSYAERPALPMQSTQGTPQGRWAGGRSQLAYGPKPAQGIEGMFAGQQQAAMPTQAQINSTQEAPRADTMAQADALGMPAPNPLSIQPQTEGIGQAARQPNSPVSSTQAVPTSYDYQLPSFVTAQYAKPKLGPNNTANVTNISVEPASESRSALLQQIPPESRGEARRMTNAQLRARVEAERNPVSFSDDTIGYTREDYPMPTAQGGTIFTSPSGRRMSPFPQVDYSTPKKHKASNAKVAQWLIDEAKQEAAPNEWRSLMLRGAKADNLAPAMVDDLVDILSNGVEQESIPAQPFLKNMGKAERERVGRQKEGAEVESLGPAYTSYSGKPDAAMVNNSPVKATSEAENDVIEYTKQSKEYPYGQDDTRAASRDEGTAQASGRRTDQATGNTAIGAHEEVQSEASAGVVDGRRPRSVRHLPQGEGGRRGEEREGNSGTAVSQGDGRRTRLADGTRDSDGRLLARSGARSGRIARDFRITPEHNIGQGSKGTKYSDNIAAITLLKQLEAGGLHASPEEQAVLARYVGWGGFPEVFAKGDSADAPLARRRAEIRALLTPEEFEAARRSTTNAHYTSPQVVSAMWKAIERMGFKGGEVLEPSMGTGNFLGLMPPTLARNSKVTGVELDSLTARIAQQLYPQQRILNQGFETARLANGSFDLAISNVPFGDYKLHDPRYGKHNLFIHDYFFARSLDLVRHGGVVAFITSTGSMNSGRSLAMRELMASKARLLAAVRLPGTAFSKNALTDVTTDIIFLQKIKEGEQNTGPSWLSVIDSNVVSEKTGKSLRNNEYFMMYPDMMLGQLADDKLYPGRTALKSDGRDMGAALDAALQRVPAGVFTEGGAQQNITDAREHERRMAGENIKEGAIVLSENGGLLQNMDGELRPYAAEGKKAERIKGMIAVREALRSNLSAQMQGDEPAINATRKALNNAYDIFTKQHGFINDMANRLAMTEDPDAPLLQALEIGYEKGKDGKASTASKADVFFRRTIAQPRIIERADTPQDALFAQLATTGKIDIAAMARMTGMSENALLEDLRGSIFKDPTGDQWQTADDYLSGNVREKLRVAKTAAKKDGAYKANVEALEAVQPVDVTPADIRVDLGAGWVPATVVEAFAAKVLGTDANKITARYSPAASAWSLQTQHTALSNEYGTPEKSAVDLLRQCLNMEQATVYDQISREERVLNKAATLAAREAQRKIRDDFSTWIFEDAGRAEKLGRLYNDTFNAIRLYEADGKHLLLPGIASTIDGKPFALKDHQKNAVWRIIQKGNTLIAHAVGAGKTFEMVAAGMELKRLGMARKPLYVVPNHMLEQWSREFLQAYPAANLLVASKSDLQKEKRRKFVSRIATGNWDAVIMTHSSFGRIPVSKQRQENFIREQLDQLEDAIREEKAQSQQGRGTSENRLVKVLEKQKMRLEEKLRKLLEEGQDRKDQQVTFEELGVDFLFVDEAHNFKNLQYVTRMKRIAGLPNSSSQRATDMLLKTQFLNEVNPGRSLVFATGTPISNTVAEMYTMTRYVAPHLLKDSGLDTFDSWARQFGRVVTGMEISPDGRNFRENTRFSRFTNVPELLTMFRSFADVKTREDLDLDLPDLKGGKPMVVSVKPSVQLTTYVDDLVQRAERIRGGNVDPRQDNMLKVTSEGRLAALDMRLIDDSLPGDPAGKVARATENIYEIWKETAQHRSAQMVFCDLSVPGKHKASTQSKSSSDRMLLDEGGQEEGNVQQMSPDDLLAASSSTSFSVYDAIKSGLMDMGVPESDIAFIHDCNTDKQKADLFKRVRSGDVRVLLGSTAKMGEGTNVQERLVALHHLDAPWKPSAVEQREGRILRQGNKNNEINIFTYVTENSFDAYMWQLLEAKARFVSTSMKKDVTERDMEDISLTELSAAEAKAAATGDKRILEKVGLDNSITRLGILKHEFARNRRSKENEVQSCLSVIHSIERQLGIVQEDAPKAVDLTGKNFTLTLGGKRYTKVSDAAKAISSMVLSDTSTRWGKVGKAGDFDLVLDKYVDGYEFTIVGQGKYSSGRTTSSDGAVSRIVRAVSATGFDNRIADLHDRMERNTRSLEGARKWLANNPSFDKQGELDAAVKRSRELDEELGLSKEKEAGVLSDNIESEDGLMASLGTGTERDSTPVKVVDVDPTVVPKFDKMRDLARWLKAYFKDKRDETILSTGKTVRFGNTNIEASMKRARGHDHGKTYGGLNDLVRFAEYEAFEPADSFHPNLGGQEVYYSAMRLGEKIYAVKLKFDIPSETEFFTRKERRGEQNIEDLRYKDHSLREIEIAPVLYRGVVPEGRPAQTQGAIREITLGVLRGEVNPTSLENGALTSIAPGQFLPQRRAKALHARVNAVQRVVDALGRKAKNAAPVRVVQAFDEMPEHIQNRYAGSENHIESVYDPRSKTVWLVADNISDVGRAAEVWAHEQVVHHGLRGMFSDIERKQVLTQLWAKLGGMSNELISEIAERYGMNPRADAKARESVMEEFLANLAEKKMRNDLTAPEEKWWQRIVDAVLRAWANMVRSVSSNSPSMKATDIDGLLSALGKYVMDGESQRHSEEAFSPASLRRERQTSEAAHVAWEQLQADTAAWEQQVDAYRPTPSGEAGQRELLTVCRTPDVLQKLGAPDLPMTMTRDNLKKILSDKPDHGLPKGLVKQLPEALADPIMVFESATQAEAFVVLTELKHEGRSVMAAVHLNAERKRIRVNDISSAYRRGNDGWYIRQIEEGRLLYQDKNKSLAWARTKGLQLPRVRKLPARLSGGTILTEKDVVKPVRPEVDAPLASRKRGADSISAISPSSILEAGIRKTMGIAENSDIRRVMGEEDLGILSRIVSLPHWIAKQFPDFAKVYERQLTRMDERSAALKKSLESVPSVFGEKRLNAEDMSSLRDLIWKFEGQDPVALKGVEKYLVKETLANGREIIAANPDFYIAYKKWLDSVGKGTKAANSAMLEIRKSLDADLALAHNRMAAMSEMSDDAIKEFRQSIGHVPNYFPHHRYGAYFVQAKVGKEVVYRKHFDASTEAMAKVMKDKIVNKVRGEFPGAEWAWGKNTRLPDEVLGAPIDSEAMEQIIMAATSKIADKERAREIRETLTAGTADILKARGWNSHGIGRKGIPGFETEDISKILYDYKSGLNGWLTKMEAARDFSAALGKIDAGTSPNLWRYTSQYVKDMLRNSDRVDRITGTIKSVAFAWYLGGSIKTAFVNMTQNMVVGVPRLQMDVTGGGIMWLHGAQKAIVDRVTGNKGKGLTEEEARLVQELYGESVITDAFMEEVRGHLSGVTGATLWNKFMKVLGLPMSEVERFNRASLALAAFRAARSGNFKAKAREKYGVAGRANYEQAKQFAADVVRDAHFVYGKANMPEFMRSNTAGRMAAPMYTFRTFTHNMLAMWIWALKTQGSEGATFVAKSIGATMVLGGVTALPMYATLMALCQTLSGDDDDWTEAIRSWLPNNNVLRDVVCYGVPAMGGVNVGGSLKMETPITKGLKEGKNPQDVLGESIGDIIGIPYDLLVVKPSRMLDAHSKGSAWRTLEEAAPVAIKNGMQAWRLYTEGQTTMTGRPINDPGLPGARKLSASEAFGKALGFQPVSSTKSYDAYAAGKHSDMVRSNKIDELTVLALKTYDSGEPTGRLEMTKKLLEWNDTMRAEGKPHMLINLKDVNRRVKSRRRENRPTAKAMQKKARIDEVWQ